VKLLLDEHFPRAVAEQLRARGHDVRAVTEHPELRGANDSVILDAASAAGRAIVTEDVSDFRPLAIARRDAKRPHPGLVYTTDRQFPRSNPRTIGRLVAALERLLEHPPEGDSWEYWLP